VKSQSKKSILNKVAKELRTPKFKQLVIKNKKIYNRKKKMKAIDNEY
tara:strand:+ start:563 stop:703 length:141 start_codon:yes stop_codon:yes gene_type:complete